MKHFRQLLRKYYQELDLLGNLIILIWAPILLIILLQFIAS